MFLCKGTRVRVKLTEGPGVSAPALLHDPDGKAFPKCSVLLGPFARGKKPLKLGRKERLYFGSDYKGHEGRVRYPAHSSSSWTLVGEAVEILYTRPGSRAAGRGTRYFHEFKRPVKVYKNGRFYRIDLPSCILDDRGFVWP